MDKSIKYRIIISCCYIAIGLLMGQLGKTLMNWETWAALAILAIADLASHLNART